MSRYRATLSFERPKPQYVRIQTYDRGCNCSTHCNSLKELDRLGGKGVDTFTSVSKDKEVQQHSCFCRVYTSDCISSKSYTSNPVHLMDGSRKGEVSKTR